MYGKITTFDSSAKAAPFIDAFTEALESAPTFDSSTGTDKVHVMKARVSLYASFGASNSKHLVASAPMTDSDGGEWIPVKHFATRSVSISDMRCYVLASDSDIEADRFNVVDGIKYKRNASGNLVPVKASAKKLFVAFVGEDIVHTLCANLEHIAPDYSALTYRSTDVEIRLETLATARVS